MLRKEFLVGLTAGVAMCVAGLFALETFKGSNDVAAPRSAQAQRPTQRPQGNFAPRTPPVTIVEARSAQYGVRLQSVGVVRAARSVDLASEAAGVVTKIHFQPGDVVEKGQTLISLDDRDQRIALERLRIEFPRVKKNAARYEDLAADGAASDVEVDNAANELSTLEASLRSAELDFARRTIRAPFTGAVGITAVEPGDLVSVGQILATLDSADQRIVSFPIAQESVRGIINGLPVRAVRPRGGAVEGRISAIDTRVNAATRTLAVEAVFEVADNALLPGETVSIELEGAGATGVSAPALAVQRDRSGAFVWRLDDEGAAERVSIIVLQRDGETVIFEGAVAAGDRMISEGGDAVRAGMVFPQGAIDERVGVDGAPGSIASSAGGSTAGRGGR